MKEKDLEKLEFNKIQQVLSEFAVTKSGKDKCLCLQPCFDREKTRKNLKETSIARALIERFGKPPISEIADLDSVFQHLESKMTLSMVNLLHLARLLSLSAQLKKYEKEAIEETSILFPYFDRLYTNLKIEQEIFSAILDDTTIADDASVELSQIRRKQSKIEQQIKEKLASFLHTKYIQEPIVTIRNDRYVLPIKNEYRSDVKGFVHDISSSGATVFIEPTSIFEMNNTRNELKFEESVEINKILQRLSSLFYDIATPLKDTITHIAYLDFLFAKASYSLELEATEPIINTEKKLELIQARHPFLEKSKVVPITVSIGDDFRCLVITGPNTGGKTVALKTVGLLTLMAMSGLHIPAKENSSIFVFENIFVDIGDEQSIEKSLSTFSAHMVNIIKIIDTISENSLVLLDELGSGTDPIEGSSLAISILDYLYQKGGLILATTHYPELKNYALATSGFQNASSEFDVENLKPTYRLLMGVPGKSMAFAISEKLGLNTQVLEKAKCFVDTNIVGIEDLLKKIYDDKAKIEKEKEIILKNSNQIELLRKSLEKENKMLYSKEKEIMEKTKNQARDYLLDMKEEIAQKLKELEESNFSQGLNQIRNEINAKLKGTTPTLQESTSIQDSLEGKEIKLNMPVFIPTLGQTGTIVSHPTKSGKVQVQIGNTKINFKLSALQEAPHNLAKPQSIAKANTKKLQPKTAPLEINVIGLTVEEAIFVIDKYLDNSSLTGLKEVRIVHGKGTGALRQGIHTFLKKHPHVKSFRLGTYGEGEMGVTVVELK